MKHIPRIIHQIWSGIDGPLPPSFQKFSETWKKYHPEWEYECWDHIRMNRFVQEFYPDYWEAYQDFPYHIQRWDIIRYLILFKTGGLYADMDSECLKPFDDLLVEKQCCFSLEPEEHRKQFNLPGPYFNNALMAAAPGHSFMEKIIDHIFNHARIKYDRMAQSKVLDVFTTTGPLMISGLYRNFADKDNIYLIPPEFTSPLTKDEIREIVNRNESEQLEDKINNAYAIHYFFHGWMD